MPAQASKGKSKVLGTYGKHQTKIFKLNGTPIEANKGKKNWDTRTYGKQGTKDVQILGTPTGAIKGQSRVTATYGKQ